MLNKIIQIIAFSALILIYLSGKIPQTINAEFLSIVLIINTISITSFFFLRKETVKDLKKQSLRFTVLFMLAFSIVHFQAYLDFILGNIKSDAMFIWINTRVVSKSLLISSIAFVSYFLGYSLVPSQNLSKLKKPNIDILKLMDTKWLSYVSIAILLLFFIFIDKRYFSGGYSTINLGVSIYFALIFESCVNGVLIVNARNLYLINQRKKKVTFWYFTYYNRLPLFILFIYLLAVMFSGDRGPIIYNLLFVVASFIYASRYKFKPFHLMSLVFISASFITILGVIRRLETNESFFNKIIQHSSISNDVQHYESSFSEATRELAFSTRCVNLAVDAKEAGLESTMGGFALQDLTLLIPTLKGTLINVFNIPTQMTSSAQFLTFYDQGPYSMWGVGTSCVADTYLDFGMVGCVLVFMLLGWLIRKLEIKIFTRDYVAPFYLLIILFCFFAYSIYMPRSTILYALNKFTYIFVAIYLCQTLSKNKFSI